MRNEKLSTIRVAIIMLICFIAGTVCLIVAVVISDQEKMAERKAKRPLRIAETQRKILDLAKEIEFIRTKAGQFPEDEAELIHLRRAPMPETAWGDRIRYLRQGDQYQLSTITEENAVMIWTYFSDGNGTIHRFPF